MKPDRRFGEADWSGVTVGLLALWLLAMIALPIARWTWGESATPVALSVTVVAQALLVGALVLRSWGATVALRALGLVVVLGWIAEGVGSHTGWPFGRYSYTGSLQPTLADVPLAVPLSWWMMIVPAWAVAEAWIGDRDSLRERWAFAAVAGVAMTAWDLFLDPQMVAWGMWRWDAVADVSYFGIPWLNYAGWWLVATLITLVVRPPAMGGAKVPLLTVYALVCALEAGGLGFFWGLPGPAWVGLAAMGGCMGGALWRRR